MNNERDSLKLLCSYEAHKFKLMLYSAERSPHPIDVVEIRSRGISMEVSKDIM